MSIHFIRVVVILILLTLIVNGVYGNNNGGSKYFYGICFSPYEDGQSPDAGTYISESQIEERIKILAPYTGWIRTFGCSSGLDKIGKIARKYDLKVAVGAWIGNDAQVNEQELLKLSEVASAGEADILIVGSEALERGDVTETQLVGYIQYIKSKFPNLPITTVETYDQWQKHPDLANAVDIISVNIYPYWAGIDISVADSYSIQRYNDIVEISEGKPVIISELGWPTAGQVNGYAVPSTANAALYMEKMRTWAAENNIQYFWFEAFDENWKTEGGVGPYWGIWDSKGNTKYLIPMHPTIIPTTIPTNSPIQAPSIISTPIITISTTSVTTIPTTSTIPNTSPGTIQTPIVSILLLIVGAIGLIIAFLAFLFGPGILRKDKKQK